MAKATDLEQFREIFKDNRTWIAIGQIKKIEIIPDQSSMRALVEVFPEKYEVIARVGRESVGPGAGIYGPHQVGDLVLLALVEGNEDIAFVIRSISSKEDFIPVPATTFNTVIKCLQDKSIMFGKAGNSVPDEPFVLGKVLKQLLVDILTELNTVSTALAVHKHVGNLGSPTTPPDNASTFTSSATTFNSKKTSPVNDDKINSDIIFGEKGD